MTQKKYMQLHFLKYIKMYFNVCFTTFGYGISQVCIAKYDCGQSRDTILIPQVVLQQLFSKGGLFFLRGGEDVEKMSSAVSPWCLQVDETVQIFLSGLPYSCTFLLWLQFSHIAVYTICIYIFFMNQPSTSLSSDEYSPKGFLFNTGIFFPFQDSFKADVYFEQCSP